jgi:ferredoxin
MIRGGRWLRRIVAVTVLVSALAGFLWRLPVPPQAGPAMLRAVATGLWVSLAVAALVVLLTLLFGRVYCAALCPLGVLQDVLACASRKKSVPQRNAKRLRYGLLALTAGAIAGGWCLPAQWLEPFTVFGKMAAGLMLPFYDWVARATGLPPPAGNGLPTAAGIAVGAAAILLLAVLVFRNRRFFCTALCPVGTVLGLLARHGLMRLHLMPSDCVRCGRCVTVCPTGCIDLAGATLDNERCVRCLNCLAVCPKDAVVWRVAGRRGAAPAASRGGGADPSRRRFLIGLGGTALVSTALARLLKPGGVAPLAVPAAIYPPGAGSAQRFAAACTGCLLCVAHCPGHVLRPGNSAVPTVHLDYTRGMCEFNCRTCSTRCPTGAIRPLDLAAKRRCRIGMAVFHRSRCIAVVEAVHCGACAEHCPTGALRMVQHEGHPCPVPELNEALCIGCGNCSYPCPTRPERAMTVAAVPIQTVAADPDESMKRPTLPPPEADEEWLI